MEAELTGSKVPRLMQIMSLAVSVLIAALSAVGASGQNAKGVQEEVTSAVYLYRPSAFENRLQKITLLCDGNELVRLANGRYVLTKLEPGEHLIADRRPQYHTRIQVERGRVYYIRVLWERRFWGAAIPTFTLVDEEQGLSEIRKLRLADQADIRDRERVSSAELPLLSESSERTKALTNGDVVMMKQAGLSDELIVQKIESSPTSFDLNPDDLIELKRENLSDRIISTMIRAAGRNSGTLR